MDFLDRQSEDLLDDIHYQQAIAEETLERYSGSPCSDYQPFLLLTNFPKYVEYFAKERNLPSYHGSMFGVVHSPAENISILDFKIGSPAAALVIDLCAHLPIKAALLLGMCGGLRRHYQIGDYFVPVASIRGEGTSDFYFRPEVPALANFVAQKATMEVLVQQEARFHIGITHSTNKRFWEFNRWFRNRLTKNRAQAIEMECATLFMASYSLRLPLGALLLISDLPLSPKGVKTKRQSDFVYTNHMADHVEKGVHILHLLNQHIQQSTKGVFRGVRKRFEENLAPDHPGD